MTITVTWDNDEKTIIRMGFETTMSWEEYDAGIVQIAEMARTVDQSVFILIDAPNTAMPRGGNAFQHLRHALDVVPPNVKFFIGYANNLFSQAVIGSFIRLTVGKRVRLVHDSQEAYAVIRKAQMEA